MRQDINKPLYILIGLLLTALIVQGYFIYDLQEKISDEKNEVFLSSMPGYNAMTQANNGTDPFIEMQKIQEHMMQEFGHFNSTFANDTFFQSAFSNSNLSTKLDLIEKDNEYILKITIPGVDEQNIQIKNEQGMIEVSVINQGKKENNSDNYIHQESFGSYFQRSFTMPDNADLSTIDSDYKNGVLTLTIKKKN